MSLDNKMYIRLSFIFSCNKLLLKKKIFEQTIRPCFFLCYEDAIKAKLMSSNVNTFLFHKINVCLNLLQIWYINSHLWNFFLYIPCIILTKSIFLHHFSIYTKRKEETGFIFSTNCKIVQNAGLDKTINPEKVMFN